VTIKYIRITPGHFYSRSKTNATYNFWSCCREQKQQSHISFYQCPVKLYAAILIQSNKQTALGVKTCDVYGGEGGLTSLLFARPCHSYSDSNEFDTPRYDLVELWESVLYV
jgi:hypothetical protein